MTTKNEGAAGVLFDPAKCDHGAEYGGHYEWSRCHNCDPEWWALQQKIAAGAAGVPSEERLAEFERLFELSRRSLLSMAQVDWLIGEVQALRAELAQRDARLSHALEAYENALTAVKRQAKDAEQRGFARGVEKASWIVRQWHHEGDDFSTLLGVLDELQRSGWEGK